MKPKISVFGEWLFNTDDEKELLLTINHLPHHCLALLTPTFVMSFPEVEIHNHLHIEELYVCIFKLVRNRNEEQDQQHLHKQRKPLLLKSVGTKVRVCIHSLGRTRNISVHGHDWHHK